MKGKYLINPSSFSEIQKINQSIEGKNKLHITYQLVLDQTKGVLDETF